MRALFLSLAVSLALVGGASAASKAILITPPAKPSARVFDGRVWHCDGSACQARGRGRSQGVVRECARVARKLGPLLAYARDGVALDEASLQHCNREARAR